MKIFIPAILIFLLAFIGLSIGIIFGRKGISGSCSSNEGKLADLTCTCGRDDAGASCENIAVEVIDPEKNPEAYQALLADIKNRDTTAL
ncbi:hypothetical protein [uncultured Desulfuromonas sp.]|uniref:hypothetical protein n=1 Tax=uncultured Desulfuromonas sp. TaxID=181013 RepID=UPI002AAB3A9D|nr:hypothetical protein [uncultured Desulfuromonas sp.]